MKEHYILTTEVGPSLGRRPGRRNLNRGLDSHKHASRGGLELGNKFAGGEGACQFERGRTCRIEYVWFSALQAAQTGRQILSQNFRGTTFLCGFFLWPSDDPKALACGPLPGILKVPKKFTRPCADSDLSAFLRILKLFQCDRRETAGRRLPVFAEARMTIRPGTR